MTADEFFQAVDSEELTSVDRAIALLWFIGSSDVALGLTAKQICEFVEKQGHPKQNVSRLDAVLAADRRTAKAGPGLWRLVPKVRRDLDNKFESIVSLPKKILVTNSVLPHELFKGSRTYLGEVVRQVNASYDYGLFDCSAVMCRRLLETLIIEVYESIGRAGEIKGPDGNFLMFAPLLAFLEKDPTQHISRSGMKGLRDFKQLGDLSAHNRRFNAHKNDIDRIRDGLRIAAGELLVMAALRH